jgi:hypothetical protein
MQWLKFDKKKNMHPEMPANELLRFGRFGMQVIGYVTITVVGGILILAWLSTAVLFQRGTRLKHSDHLRLNPK